MNDSEMNDSEMNDSEIKKIPYKNQNQVLKFIYLFIILALIYLFEYSNREKLIQKSIDISELYSSYISSHNDFLQKYIQIANLAYMKVIMGFIFLFFPINKAFTFLNAFIYSSYIENAIKLLFGPPMPINNTNDLLTYFSNGSESPSSNLISTTCSVLSLWELLINTYSLKENRFFNVIKYTIIFFIILLISSITLCEVILQMHSLNKAIYGIFFGFCIYYILFVIFALHKVSAKEFFHLFKNKRITFLLKLSYFIEVLLLFFLYYLLQKELNLIEPLLIKIKTKVQTQFSDTALINGLSIILLFGSCHGLEYLNNFSVWNFPRKHDEINNWNKVSLKILVIITVILGFYSFGIIVYSIIPLESPFGVILILKTGFPYFIISYALFGPAIVSCIIFSLANSDIYDIKEGYGSAYRENGLELKLTNNVINV